MKKGDVIMIYDDPITRTKEEGKAKLVKCLNENDGTIDGKNLERWEVVFLDEPKQSYGRTICND